MAQHPNKHIRAAIEYAVQHGWRFTKASGRAHIWGTLRCRERSREGCQYRVYSTPRSPEDHAKDIRREVDRCPHGHTSTKMAKYEFSLILSDADVSDEQADAIYAAGCDDGFIVTRSGVTQVNFYREASSLEEAIKSAAADLQKAGVRVARVELDPHVLAGA